MLQDGGDGDCDDDQGYDDDDDDDDDAHMLVCNTSAAAATSRTTMTTLVMMIFVAANTIADSALAGFEGWRLAGARGLPSGSGLQGLQCCSGDVFGFELELQGAGLPTWI